MTAYNILNATVNTCPITSPFDTNINKRLRNATSRINTAFFVAKIKNLLTVCDIIELLSNHKSRPERRYIYDNTKATHFGRYF